VQETNQRPVSDHVGDMATKESNSDENTVETCIFCLIANKKDEETTILKETKDLVCFRDIDPAAPHHYLVVPREHIYSCFLLHKGHINLVERMAKLGKDVLRDQGITDMMDIRLGFHQPPYISVGHLHLHVLAPTSQISKYMEYNLCYPVIRRLSSIPGKIIILKSDFSLNLLE
uniref:HIT domain-containing protein n=1 Tax=Amphilophus citrinellus TaxID=61819 RepID=A0A3Q0R231_AMPCI